MTLPSLNNPSEGEGRESLHGGNGENARQMRPTARTLRDRRKHILNTIKWSRSLEDDLVECGLLPDSQESLDEGAKTGRVLDEIVQRRSAEGMRQLLTVLETHNNEDLATSLKADMETQTDNDDSQGATGVESEVTQKELLSLRKRLEDSERQARQWKMRAQHLETEKLSLETTLKSEVKEVQQPQGESKSATEKKESPRETKDSPRETKDSPRETKDSPRETKDSSRETKGLLLARRKDKESLILCKTAEETATVSVVKFPDQKVVRDLSQKDKQRRRGVTEPGRLLPLLKPDDHDRKANTLPMRLPSLTRVEPINKLNKTDVHLGKYAPLPSIDHSSADGHSQTEKISEPEVHVNPSKEWSEEGLSCKMNEKWIDKSGGEIQLPNVVLHVPPNSVAQPVLVSVTETEYSHVRQQQINSAGLEDFLQPGMQLRLQPHGLRFLRPVFLEMKNVKLANNVRLLVFHKDVEPHIETPWTDITTECAPKVRKDDVVLAIESFSIVETIKLLVPMMSLAAGIAIGYKMHACALFNSRLAPCNFYVYYKAPDPFLVVFVEAQHSDNNNHLHQMTNEPGYTLVGYGSSKYPLIDEENLLFYYHSCPNLAGAFPLKLEQCMTKGQRFHVPVSAQSIEDLPNSLYIRRRIAGIVAEQDLSEVRLGICPHPSKEPIWEKVLRCHRVQVTKDLDIQNIMPRLRQDNIINVNEEEELLAIPVKQRQAGKLLDIIVTKGPAAFKVFTESMEDDYKFIAEKLWGEYLIASSTKESSSGPKLVPQPPSKPKVREAIMGTVT